MDSSRKEKLTLLYQMEELFAMKRSIVFPTAVDILGRVSVAIKTI